MRARGVPPNAAGEKTVGRPEELREALPDPHSSGYLDLFGVGEIPAVRGASGTELRLMKRVPIYEYPAYDPVTDLDKISIAWRRVSGPAAHLLEPHSVKASVKLPEVAEPSELVFSVVLSNASGSRTGELRVRVVPRP